MWVWMLVLQRWIRLQQRSIMTGNKQAHLFFSRWAKKKKRLGWVLCQLLIDKGRQLRFG
jgi:hypothetical protein